MDDIDPPNVLLWGVLPGFCIFCILCCIALIIAGLVTPVASEHLKNEDDKPLEVKTQNRVLSIVMSVCSTCMPIICAFIIGSSLYQLGMIIKNPKVGASMAVRDMTGVGVYHHSRPYGYDGYDGYGYGNRNTFTLSI